MNSFIGIAESNTTNLAVVAPGIAEALLATGIGLYEVDRLRRTARAEDADAAGATGHAGGA